MLQDVGSEKAVLAGIYQYGKDALIDIDDIISSDTFTIEENQLLFLCLKKALEENISIDLTAIVTTAERMQIDKKIVKEKKDISYLRALINFPIKLENVRGYAKRLAKLAFARRAQERHKQAYDELGQLKGSESIDEILAISEGTIFDLIQEINQGRNDQPQSIGQDSTEIIQHLIDHPCEMPGFPTPWPCYNTVIGGGLRKGGVDLIASRSGVGKTVLGKEVALHFAINLKIPVLMLDTEMSISDQLFRSLASLSRISINQIETGQFDEDELSRVWKVNKLLQGLLFYHISIAGKPFEEILSIIRRWIVKEVGYDENGNVKDCLIIYDYFKLMSPEGLNNLQEYQAIGFQISRLSDFCKEYQFPCLAFTQVNRDGIRRETSDIISQSDRLLWLCHSVSLFKPKELEERLEDDSNRKLIVLKSRFGPGMDSNNYINMKFEGKYAKVIERGFQSEIERQNTIRTEGFENEIQPGNDLSGVD